MEHHPPSPVVFSMLTGVLVATTLLVSGCNRAAAVESKPDVANAAQPAQASSGSKRQIRATGTIQAVRAFSVQVPQISGQNNRLTLVKVIANGAHVKLGDTLAEFDRNLQVTAALDAKAKYEDFQHQVEKKEAQNKSDAEKRSGEIKQAEADLAKAEIQLQKGPVLSEIDRLKNEAKAESARARTLSLQKINRLRSEAEAAALKILQLQMQRQNVALERSETNAASMVLKAPIEGMVALENMWRGGSMGNAQEGDQLGTGQVILRIFDPTQMEVRTLVGEPDGASLTEGTVATVYVDAYPDAVFKARFHSASPVATSALGSPIKNFTARFVLEGMDPRLLPDLSAAVIVTPKENTP